MLIGTKFKPMKSILLTPNICQISIATWKLISKSYHKYSSRNEKYLIHLKGFTLTNFQGFCHRKKHEKVRQCNSSLAKSRKEMVNQLDIFISKEASHEWQWYMTSGMTLTWGTAWRRPQQSSDKMSTFLFIFLFFLVFLISANAS